MIKSTEETLQEATNQAESVIHWEAHIRAGGHKVFIPADRAIHFQFYGGETYRNYVQCRMIDDGTLQIHGGGTLMVLPVAGNVANVRIYDRREEFERDAAADARTRAREKAQNEA